MKFLKTIRAWWHGLFRKRRFNMLNATDNTEEWHMHLSPASILAGLVAFVLMLFILTLSLVAYSPVLEFLPGYRTEADRSRESLVQNIIRLDSMERMMNDMLTYNENIALIMEGRTPVPERERLASLAAHGATMVIFLSIGLIDKVQAALLQGAYTPDTPAAVVYKASWPEEKIVRCTVGSLAESTRAAGITKTALIVVGDFLGTQYERSKLYDPAFTTEFRKGEQV